jgi:hypothetical protein
MRKALVFLASFVFLLLAGSACGHGGSGGSGGGGGNGTEGSIIVGVTSDLRVGVDIDRLHVVMRAGGALLSDEVLTTASKTLPLALPAEFPFENLPGGTPVDIAVDAFRPGDAVNPLVTRLAATTVVAGKTLLLRVVIDSRCVVAPGSSAPSCTAPETCVAGQCADEHLDPGILQPYSPSWSKGSTDICKPASGGAPVIFVGEGQADYLPTMDGDVAQVEAGPQGGHHIWVAIRMKNLHQSGSITSITGHFPDLGVDVGPFNVIFTFEQDEGGFCKLYGLRFQLDQANDITTLLGHPLDVTVKVTDPEQDVGIGKRSVVLSKDFLQ